MQVNAPEGDLSVVLEDDGRVAYAYLLEGGTVVGDVWLYNILDSPGDVDWENPSLMPFLNPAIYCNSEQAPRLRDGSNLSCDWSPRGVEIWIDGIHVARLEVGAKPGWSRSAIRSGPLAKPLDGSVSLRATSQDKR
jgi:hypothetical protein